MPWDLVWALVLGVFLLSYAVFEIWAKLALDDNRGTLTAAVRRWAGISPYQRRAWITIPLLSVLFLWLPVHFLTPWL